MKNHIRVTAVSLALTVLFGGDRATSAQPINDEKSEIQYRRTNASTFARRLKKALDQAQLTKSLDRLLLCMSEPSFGADPYLSTEDGSTVAVLVPQILRLVESMEPSYKTMRCQAYIGRYFLSHFDFDNARKYYEKALEDLNNHHLTFAQMLTIENQYEPKQIREGCSSGLVLVYAHKNLLDQAETNYRNVLLPLANLSAAEKEGRLRLNAAHITEHSKWSLIAVRLGQAYERAGKFQEAAQKYEDVLAYETFNLNNTFNDPRGSMAPIMIWSSSSDPRHPTNFDIFVGTLPLTEQLVTPFVEFGRKHPDIIPMKKVQEVASKVDKRANVRKAHATMGTNIKARLHEMVQLNHLSERPEQMAESFKADIAERKKVNNADPSIAHSLNTIGYQFIQTGLYKDAEEFLKDAIARREAMGAAGRYALGNSWSNLGSLYVEENRLPEARILLQKARTLRQDDPQDEYAERKTQLQLAKLLLAEGKKSAAEAELRIVVAKLATADPASVNPAESFKSGIIRNPAEMGAAMEKLSARSDAMQTGRLYYLLAKIELANVLLLEKKYDEARATMEPVLADLPPTADLFIEARAHEKLGRIDTAQNKLQSADRHLATAEKLLREHKAAGSAAVDILNALGDLKTKEGNKAAAKSYYAEAAQLKAKMLRR